MFRGCLFAGERTAQTASSSTLSLVVGDKMFDKNRITINVNVSLSPFPWLWPLELAALALAPPRMTTTLIETEYYARQPDGSLAERVGHRVQQ